MNHDRQRLTSEEWANLVAYVDGELSADQAQAITSKLGQSVTARRELESLKRTWELLDHLRLPESPQTLLGQTLSRIQQDEEVVDRRFSRTAGWAHSLLAGAGIAALCALAFGAGWWGTAHLWPDPTARLARDLSLAERLPEYRAIGSFERLQELDRHPVSVPPSRAVISGR